MPESVLRLSDISISEIAQLLGQYQLSLELTKEPEIPGSFWGEDEAGLIGYTLYAKPTTPIHSILHEGCHFICMDQKRRDQLDTDAEGDFDEENAVCYLQILLADQIPGMGRERMQQDMDRWGYTFRLGSSRAWFEKDADDAREWLYKQELIDQDQNPTYQLRR